MEGEKERGERDQEREIEREIERGRGREREGERERGRGSKMQRKRERGIEGREGSRGACSALLTAFLTEEDSGAAVALLRHLLQPAASDLPMCTPVAVRKARCGGRGGRRAWW